jgi:hypothetical protein
MDSHRKSKNLAPKLKIITEGSYLRSNRMMSSRTTNEKDVGK